MARILLADDDKATRDLVKRAIEMDGHTVILAEDGAEAQSVFDREAGRIDLLVSDVEMPGVDGVALARHALAASGKVRVLLMSGYAESLERSRGIDKVRLAVIPKPFTLEQIRRSIASVLS